MPFTSGHELTSVCCTQLPTVSPMTESGGLPVGQPQPGPQAPPPPPPLPNPPKFVHSRSAIISSAADGTGNAGSSSAHLDAPSQGTSNTDFAQHGPRTMGIHSVDNPSTPRNGPEASQGADHSNEQCDSLHNTGRSQSGASAGAHHAQVRDGDGVQSFWPQSLSQDGTALVCREYLWIPSTLYRGGETSPALATAVHLLSVMHPHLHAFPGSSQMRYVDFSCFWCFVPDSFCSEPKVFLCEPCISEHSMLLLASAVRSLEVYTEHKYYMQV